MPTLTHDLPRTWLVPGLLLASVGFAAGPARAGEPARTEPFGVRATPRPIPAGLLTTELPEPLYLGPAKSNVFYLNYDGVTIKYTGGLDDSSQNVSMFQDFALTYTPYGEGAKRAASLQAFKADWTKYKVTITDQRPQSGNYLMGVFSPTNPFGGGVLGVAPLDCDDQLARNIVWAYHSANDQFSATTQATTMSQEVAHAFGLEHVMEPKDVMNPYNAGGDAAFLDQCFSLIDAQCGQHSEFCGGGGQNSHKELMALFGASAPDMKPPTVQITSPSDGQVLGPDFDIIVEASDDVGVAEVQLFTDGQLATTWDVGPFSTKAMNTPAGAYCFTASALDDSGNKADSGEVCVTVTENSQPDPATTTGEPDPDPPTTGAGETGGGSGSGAESTGGEGDGGGTSGSAEGGEPSPDSATFGDPGLPPGYGQDDGGGACNVEPRPLPLAGLALLLLGLLRRRRGA